jgi:hypothetical protein
LTLEAILLRELRGPVFVITGFLNEAKHILDSKAFHTRLQWFWKKGSQERPQALLACRPSSYKRGVTLVVEQHEVAASVNGEEQLPEER